MERNPDARCENCPYMDKDDVWASGQQLDSNHNTIDDIGVCLRFPPIAKEDSRDRDFADNMDRPSVFFFDVCGEHPDFFKPQGENHD